MSATNTGWRLMLLDAPQVSLSLETSPILMELVSPGPQGASGAGGGGNVNVVSGDGITVTESPADTFTVRANFGSAGNTVCEGNDARLSDARPPTAHGHVIGDVSGLQTALDAKAAASHSHAIADVTGLQTALDGKAASSHAHAVADVTGLQTALDGKSNVGHGHAISDVSGLQTALDGKASTSHTHVANQISDSTAVGRSVLTAATAAAGATALGLGTGDTPTFTGVAFPNGESITNAVNGRIEFNPSPTGSTAWRLYADMTSFNVGVRLGVINSDTNIANPTGSYIVFDTTAQISTDKSLSIHSNDWMQLRGTSTGLDTAQLSVLVNNAGSSGAFALVDLGSLGTANRSPTTAHIDPHLYVYSADTNEALDFVRVSHNRTDGVIESGNGDLRLVAPGEVRFNGNLMQSRLTVAQSRLLGRGASSGSGQPQEITIGSGLSLTGTTLSATGGGSGGVSKAFAIAMAVAL
jgi:hypothetical protein